MFRHCVATLLVVAGIIGAAGAQDGSRRGGGQRPSAGAMPTVETAPLALVDPTPYLVTNTLEPGQRVVLRAQSDGVVREVAVVEGSTVKRADLVVRIDPSEAQARMRIAEAQLAEQELIAQAKAGSSEQALAKVRVDAAKAQLELARLALAAMNLVAPFDGQVLTIQAGPGQFVLKGDALATVADTSVTRAFVPVDRAGAKVGDPIELSIEGQAVVGKIQAIVPLADSSSRLRELAAPFATAVVLVPNAERNLQVGARVESPFVPSDPITSVEKRAVKRYADGTSSVQVLRDSVVATVMVRVFGETGADKMQLAGPLRATDLLIMKSSVPLVDGTIVEFDGANSGAFNPNVAPIGAGAGSTKPAGANSAPKGTAAPKGAPF